MVQMCLECRFFDQKNANVVLSSGVRNRSRREVADERYTYCCYDVVFSLYFLFLTSVLTSRRSEGRIPQNLDEHRPVHSPQCISCRRREAIKTSTFETFQSSQAFVSASFFF